MLVQLSKFFVILILAQCVTSVDFYISKRVKPKYKEIRRQYSSQITEENADSPSLLTNIIRPKYVLRTSSVQSSKSNEGIVDRTLDESLFNTNSDQKVPIGSVQTIEVKNPSFSSGEIKPNLRTLNIQSLKSPEENIDSHLDYVKKNSDQNKISIDSVQTTEVDNPTLPSSIIQPELHTLNVQSLNNNEKNAGSKLDVTLININTDQQKVSIENGQTVEVKNPSSRTRRIRPKLRTLNVQSLKNSQENVNSELGVTLINENSNQKKVSIGSVQTSEVSNPSLSSIINHPELSSLSVQSLKNKEENVNSKLDATMLNKNTDQKKVSIETVKTVEVKNPSSSIRIIRPKLRTLSVQSLKNSQGSANSKLGVTLVNEKKVSIDSVQATEVSNPSLSSSELKGELSSLSVQSSKNNEDNADSKLEETLINKNTAQKKGFIESAHTVELKNPSLPRRALKPKLRTLNIQSLKSSQGNANSKLDVTLVNENSNQGKISTDSVQTTEVSNPILSSSIIKPELSSLNVQSLKNNEDNADSKLDETLINKNTDQKKISIESGQTVEVKNPSLPRRALKPKLRTLNIQSVKNSQLNANSKLDVTLVNENSNKKKVSIDSVQTPEDSYSKLSASINKPEPSTLNVQLLKNNKENADSKLDVALVSKNTDQKKVSIESEQTVEVKNPSSPTRINRPKLRKLNIPSLRNSQGNSNRKLDVTLVNKNTNQKEVSIESEQTVEVKNTNSSPRVIRPKLRTVNVQSLENSQVNANSKLDVTLLNESIQQKKDSIGSIEITDINNPRLSSSIIKPNPRLSNVKSFKNNQEKVESGLDVTLVNKSPDQKKVLIGTVKTVENKNPTLPTRVFKPKLRTLNVQSLKNNQGNSNREFDVTLVTKNTDQKKGSIESIQTVEVNKPSLSSSIGKPNRRTLNIQSSKNQKSAQSGLGVTLANESADQKKILIETVKTVEPTRPSLTTRVIKPRLRTSNVQSVKNKQGNGNSELDLTLANKNTDQKKVSIETVVVNNSNLSSNDIKPNMRSLNINALKINQEIADGGLDVSLTNNNADQKQISIETVKAVEVKNPSLPTRVVRPKQRTLNVQSLNKNQKNSNSKLDTIIINTNTDQNKASIDVIETTKVNDLSLSRRVIKPELRILNKQALNNNEENPDSKRDETFVTKNPDQNKASIENVQINEAKSANLPTRALKSKLRTLNVQSSKYREGNDNIKHVETLVDKITHEQKASIANVQNTKVENPIVSTNIIKPQLRTLNVQSLKNSEGNADSRNDDKFVNTKTDQDKLSGDNVKVIEVKNFSLSTRTIKANKGTINLQPLKIKKENPNNKQGETFVNKTTNQEKISIANEQTFATKNPDQRILNPSSATSVTEPKLRTFRIQSVNINEENANSQDDETVVSRNSGQRQLSTANKHTTEIKTPILTTSTTEAKQRTKDHQSLKNREENPKSNNDEKIVNKNINKQSISTDNVQSINNENPSLITTTLKSRGRTLSLHSIGNTDSKNDATFVNSNSDQKKILFDNIKSTVSKGSSLITSTIKVDERSFGLHSLKNKEGNADTKHYESVFNKNADKVRSYIDTVQTTEVKNPSLTISTITKAHNLNVATPELGRKRITTAQGKTVVQGRALDAETKSNQKIASEQIKTEKYFEIANQKEITGAQSSQAYKNNGELVTLNTQAGKGKGQGDNTIPIVGLENYVYANIGDYHYSYEGGDGTKAFERGELPSVQGNTNVAGVVGGFSYKDKDGHDISLSYTAGEDGYRPVGAHLPTPPPIPPAIQRVLRILATKTTPEPVTDSIAWFN